PGGTTAAGVLAAEKAGFRQAAAAFVCAASQKSRQMS
ncbi:MAG: pyrroline-5-carboxylate reductase, partial [Proteobacteria bacterium]|nr:pyrroline-5-carboxylate reductase [Pseudomonadota bacterium]